MKVKAHLIPVAGSEPRPKDTHRESSQSAEYGNSGSFVSCNPLRLPPQGPLSSKPHGGIQIARLRILLLLHIRVSRHPVGNGICRDLGFVHLQERTMSRPSRRPEVIAAHAQLLRVHPVDFAIQHSHPYLS